MADLAITKANVVSGSGAETSNGTAGEATVAGDAVYQSSSDLKYYLADANAAGKDAVAGICLNDAAANQRLTIQTRGPITIGGTLAATPYVLSATPGKLAPAADLASGWKVSVIGAPTSTTVLQLGIINTGLAVP